MSDEQSGECTLFDVGCWTDWVFQAFADFLLWMFEGVLSGVAGVLESIQMPGWVQNIAGLSLPDSVVFWMSFFEIQTGLTIIASAYGVRFLIRRIPIIG
ncbi:MAG TPA: hypothetical protein EYG20_10055 [Alcanivorax sp.]|nr:hypothetical protein [Alcanivorax sp.]